MVIGPVEYLVVEFPGNKFSGEIVPELAKLIESGIVRLLDLVFISKDAEGNVAWVNLDEADGEFEIGFLGADASLADLLSEEDIAIVAAELAPNSSAGLLVWENTWAAGFAAAVRNANGRVVDSDRIPHDVVLAALNA